MRQYISRNHPGEEEEIVPVLDDPLLDVYAAFIDSEPDWGLIDSFVAIQDLFRLSSTFSVLWRH